MKVNGYTIEPGANLTRASLRWADLSGANLERAKLRRANLRQANLEGADLSGANFKGTNLKGANLKFAAEMARKTGIKSDSEPQSPRPAEGRSSSTTSSQSRRSAAGERRPTTSAREPGLSVAEELERFANLRDRGVLSDEEFEAQKSKLLDG